MKTKSNNYRVDVTNTMMLVSFYSFHLGRGR